LPSRALWVRAVVGQERFVGEAPELGGADVACGNGRNSGTNTTRYAAATIPTPARIPTAAHR